MLSSKYTLLEILPIKGSKYKQIQIINAYFSAQKMTINKISFYTLIMKQYYYIRIFMTNYFNNLTFVKLFGTLVDIFLKV